MNFIDVWFSLGEAVVRGIAFHQISFLTSKGIQIGVATAVFSIIGPSQLPGIFIAGFMADRFPNRYLLVVGQVLLMTLFNKMADCAIVNRRIHPKLWSLPFYVTKSTR